MSEPAANTTEKGTTLSTRDDWRELDRESRRAGLRIGGWIIVAVLFVGIIGAGTWGFRVLTADAKGRGDQVIKTKGNADYRMAAYDHFADLCASVQAAEDKLALAKQQAEAIKDPEKRQQADVNVFALASQRAELVRQYNADAAKQATIGQFKAADLPARIDPTQESTTCAS